MLARSLSVRLLSCVDGADGSENKCTRNGIRKKTTYTHTCTQTHTFEFRYHQEKRKMERTVEYTIHV